MSGMGGFGEPKGRASHQVLQYSSKFFQGSLQGSLQRVIRNKEREKKRTCPWSPFIPKTRVSE